MKVLHVCSELYPLIKTGGLADVMGALPFAQQEEGMNVRVVLPFYPAVREKIGETGHVAYFHTFAGNIEIRYADFQGLGVYLIDAPHLFEREGNPYHDHNYHDYQDNFRRFALLAWAGASLAAGADIWWGKADVLHAHDWQAGLACAYLHTWNASVKTIFTIHNLAYSGSFDARHLGEIDLPHHLFQTDGLEFFGQISYLKAGLYYADHITTVSPTYAKEITTTQHGYGFHGLLQTRADQGRLTGILNGVDSQVWNPDQDDFIEKKYNHRNVVTGKRKNKKQLQELFDLPKTNKVPLLVMVTRLVEQKGADILLAAADQILKTGAQLIILGTGAPHLEEAFLQLKTRYPDQVGVKITYDEALSHQIIAGGDVILIPSRFEPCGLTQLYGLKYGTLPLVRSTGGLADTVSNTHLASAETRGTGFVFHEADHLSLLEAITNMTTLWQEPKLWKTVRFRAMKKDFGWHKAAKAYQKIYL